MASDNLIKVYSHPRSGTHFLEALIALNFYPNVDLEIKEVVWGHWSNRKVREEPNPYGKLFGSHIFPDAVKIIGHPAVYIYRDPRSVAYSIWRTPNFINPLYKELSFSEFINSKIDWVGSPAFKCRKKFNIFQHWEKHVLGWMKIAEKNSNLVVVRYEDLKFNPRKELSKIAEVLGFKLPDTMSDVKNPVGLLPNKALIDGWKEVFSEKDLLLARKSIKSVLLRNIYFENSSYN